MTITPIFVLAIIERKEIPNQTSMHFKKAIRVVCTYPLLPIFQQGAIKCIMAHRQPISHFLKLFLNWPSFFPYHNTKCVTKQNFGWEVHSDKRSISNGTQEYNYLRNICVVFLSLHFFLVLV